MSTNPLKQFRPRIKKTTEPRGHKARVGGPARAIDKAPKPHSRQSNRNCWDREALVQCCIERMSSGRWVTATTPRDIAMETGYAQVTVMEAAHEASRRIKADTLGHEASRAHVRVTIETILKQCMEKGDHRHALQALAMITGLDSLAEFNERAKEADANRFEIRVVGPADAFSSPLTLPSGN